MPTWQVALVHIATFLDAAAYTLTRDANQEAILDEARLFDDALHSAVRPVIVGRRSGVLGEQHEQKGYGLGAAWTEVRDVRQTSNLSNYYAANGTLGTLRNIQWLHIPKSGTSFLATLWNYACGQNTTIDLEVDPRYNNNSECRKSCYDFALMERYPKDTYCKHGVLHKNFQTVHVPLPKTGWQDHMSVVSMFRRPSQRLLSAFHHSVMHAAGFRRNTAEKLERTCKNQGAHCYARFEGIAGCMARMLTGGQCAEDPLDGWRESVTQDLDDSATTSMMPKTSSAEAVDSLEAIVGRRPRAKFNHGLDRVAEAVKVIKQLSFVGLTEEWDESICLFHRMFGGRMNHAEFKDFHQGSGRQSHYRDYDESELGGFVDEADEQVYAAAKARFYELHQQHVPIGTSACDVTRSFATMKRCSCAGEGRECGQMPSGDCDCGSCPHSRLVEFYKLTYFPVVCSSDGSGQCQLKSHRMHDIYSWSVNPCLFNRTCPSPRKHFPTSVQRVAAIEAAHAAAAASDASEDEDEDEDD